jgi:hypothetical protein
MLLNIMAWKTYLIMHFGTNGKKPTEIAKAIESLGFVSNFGSVDFIYQWSSAPTKKQVLELGDRISELLKGSGSVFNLDTSEQA